MMYLFVFGCYVVHFFLAFHCLLYFSNFIFLVYICFFSCLLVTIACLHCFFSISIHHMKELIVIYLNYCKIYGSLFVVILNVLTFL